MLSAPTRTACVLLSSLALGCASTQKPSAAGAAAMTTPGSDPLSQRADELLRALQAGDAQKAWSMFDAHMRAALPVPKIGATLQALHEQAGALEAWAPLKHEAKGDAVVQQFDLTFERSHLLGLVSLHSATGEVSGLFFTPLPHAAKSAPSAFHAEEVTVGAAPFALGGTLTLPKGSGPWPAAVLVAGSGPNDRDETQGPNKPLRDIAEGLAAKGIATLRYDKRSFAHGKEMDLQQTTVEEEVIADAVAALQLLRARPEIDGKHLFVVGHSLGAMLAPEIAQRAAPVAGVVMLAPGFGPLPLTVVEQMRYLGAPDAQVAEVEAQAKRLVAGEMPESESFLGVPAHYWLDLQRRDEVGIAKRLGVPLLLLRGERDYQVTAQALDGWRTALTGTPHVTIETLPNLNHLFLAGTGKPGPAEYATPGHVDAAAIAKLAGFITGP